MYHILKELGIESFFVPIEADGKVFKDHGLKKIYQVVYIYFSYF